MRISNLTDYAVLILTKAAQLDPQSREMVRFKSGELSALSGIPSTTVQKLVNKLTKAGILHSYRGIGGGLSFAKALDAISLLDIIESIEGPIRLTACANTVKIDCKVQENCCTRPHWSNVNQTIRGTIAAISLKQLIEEAPPSPIRQDGRAITPPIKHGRAIAPPIKQRTVFLTKERSAIGDNRRGYRYRRLRRNQRRQSAHHIQ